MPDETVPELICTLPADYPHRELVLKAARHAYKVFPKALADWCAYGVLQAPFEGWDIRARAILEQP